MPDKIIVTNQSALKTKYGAATASIDTAVKALVTADKARGVQTQVIALDAPGAGIPKVTSRTNARQAKATIDAIYKKFAPDYVMILGAADVVPHVDLKNTMPGDGDPTVPSDLPYACEAAYTNDVTKYLGPTRVLGRLPDLPGARDPKYLLGLLKTAAAWKRRPAADYAAYFGLTAAVWKGSTEMSLQKTFGNSTAMNMAPPKGPDWTAAALKPLAHFINCHGSSADPQFYGQLGPAFPVSMKAAQINTKIVEGTVAAAECCYGAQLYDPALAAGTAGIGLTYLANRGYGYVGSTNIAYGPADGNGSADLVCQYFLRGVLAGGSTGRAMLEARQKFVEGASEMAPEDLKTLAQFLLLGDPSVHPVVAPDAPQGSTAKGMPAAMAAGFTASKPARAERRRVLFLRGTALSQAKPYAAATTAKATGNVAKQWAELTKGLLGEKSVYTYEVRSPAAAKTMMAKAMPAAGKAKTADKVMYHVAFGKRQAGDGLNRGVAIVAKSAGGAILKVKELYLK